MSASTSEAISDSGAPSPPWRCSISGENSDSESTSEALWIDWMSDSNEGTSESYDEKSPSVVGGVARAARAAVSGRVAFGRRMCVRRCVGVSLPEREVSH